MDINHEFKSLENELEQIFTTCPLSWDRKVNMNDLFDQLSVKYGENIVELLKEEVGLSSNVLGCSVSFDDFVVLMKNFYLRCTTHNLHHVDFLTTESIENGNSSNEEFSNNNDELDKSNLEDIKYLRDSKKDLSEKLLKAETTVQTLEDRLKNVKKINIQLMKEIEIMRGDVNRIQLIENENEELREKLIKLEIKCKHSNDHLKKKISRNQILEEENYSLTEKINKLQKNIDKKMTLLSQNEQNCKILHEEINFFKEQNSSLLKEAEKATVNSELNENLYKRIDDLMHEKSNLQFQISDYELNAMHNFDRLNESSVNEMRMTLDNSGVSLRAELSGIYDPEMEVFQKLERIASSQTVSTQTDNVTNSVCSQTDIVKPELLSQRVSEHKCDILLIKEMELSDDLGIVKSFGKNDPNVELSNMEIMSAINRPLKYTPLNYINKPRNCVALQKFSHDRSPRPYRYSFFSYLFPRIISNGFFYSVIFFLHQMTKFIGKKFNKYSFMIILFSIFAYVSFVILVQWKKFCTIYGNDNIASCLIQHGGFKITYPHGRPM